MGFIIFFFLSKAVLGPFPNAWKRLILRIQACVISSKGSYVYGASVLHLVLQLKVCLLTRKRPNSKWFRLTACMGSKWAFYSRIPKYTGTLLDIRTHTIGDVRTTDFVIIYNTKSIPDVSL